ncbi:hypothetical protein COCON_G00007180 [Conger conger]|uniref:RING-type domain-containing protein n=1 Tax=Conger conger TaxID=82655 RepID=A0A9Q1I7U4_CONCO|nr:hypothetical protein COCON_G00007180 [Conger conger]
MKNPNLKARTKPAIGQGERGNERGRREEGRKEGTREFAAAGAVILREEGGRPGEGKTMRGTEGRGGSVEEAKKEERERKEGQKGSAEQSEDVEDTECVVCFCTYDNVFKTPKLLSCGHTFCLECLARINVSSAEIKTLTCPVCRELTDLPHGRDLPHLGNNQEIFRKLPPEMQKAWSVRFKRSKGKLVLKKPLARTQNSPSKPSLTLPKFKKKVQEGSPGEEGDLQLPTLEHGHTQATTVNVGRPPNRVRGRIRRLFRSDQCYYAAVAAIITVAVALMLVGILVFVVVPNVVSRPPAGNNSIP